MPLTDAECRNAQPRPTSYKLTDGAGLHLLVLPSGTKSWRLRVQADNRERLMTLGTYPAMGLAAARKAAKAARPGLSTGTPPVPEPPPPKPPLRAIVSDWHDTQRDRWKPHHAADVLDSLTREIFPALGDLPADTITAPMVLAALRVIEDRGAVDTAHRVRQRLHAAYDHAIAAGVVTSNPAAGLARAMRTVIRQRHRPAMLDLADARTMLERAESIPAHPVTRLALRLLALTAVRPGELRAAEWAEFSGLDGAEPVWTIPAARMKHKRERAADTRDHVVPLSTHAVAVLAAVRVLTGRGVMVFPSLTSSRKPMSENALGYLLNRAGYAGQHVPHGWRATFSTVMNEREPSDRALIDLMLAHSPKDQVERAYNRAAHMSRRRALAQAWGDLLLDRMPNAEALLTLPRR